MEIVSGDVWEIVTNLPVPTILILAGIIFLAVAIIGHIKVYAITLSQRQRRITGGVGSLFLS